MIRETQRGRGSYEQAPSPDSLSFRLGGSASTQGSSPPALCSPRFCDSPPPLLPPAGSTCLQRPPSQLLGAGPLGRGGARLGRGRGGAGTCRRPALKPTGLPTSHSVPPRKLRPQEGTQVAQDFSHGHLGISQEHTLNSLQKGTSKGVFGLEASSLHSTTQQTFPGGAPFAKPYSLSKTC